jgi:hypothetical protein
MRETISARALNFGRPAAGGRGWVWVAPGLGVGKRSCYREFDVRDDPARFIDGEEVETVVRLVI